MAFNQDQDGSGYEPPDPPPNQPNQPNQGWQTPKKFYSDYKSMDAWFSFLKDQYGAQNSARGGGFLSGGNAYRGNLQGVVDAFNKNTGKTAKVVSGDKIDFGNGAMDVITSDGDWWYSGGANGAQANGGQNVNGTNPNFPPSGAPGGVPGGAPPGGPPGVSDELYKMLLDRAHQGTTINPNDPNIRQQVDPYAAQVERSSRNYLADAAEGLGANANMTGERRLAAEHSGQQTGMFQSQLIGREIDARRTEIQSALAQLGGQLTADQQLALQRELGYMNDATQRYGLSNNYNLGMANANLGSDYFNWATSPSNPANWPKS